MFHRPRQTRQSLSPALPSPANLTIPFPCFTIFGKSGSSFLCFIVSVKSNVPFPSALPSPANPTLPFPCFTVSGKSDGHRRLSLWKINCLFRSQSALEMMNICTQKARIVSPQKKVLFQIPIFRGLWDLITHFFLTGYNPGKFFQLCQPIFLKLGSQGHFFPP